ncbi:hypothetical protein [Limnohabitans sp. MMS-10A-192]|uniref:hypothetical protein n=1 Tax=Limnohabitans sp. MMS-10A-192 TaxID=1835769 RepID=UPI0011B210CB|nr:hypothetical protein [Limnohabitans sp. MMS-10A-192]
MKASLDAKHFNELLASVDAINNQLGRPELIELTKETGEVVDYRAGRIKLQDLSAAATEWVALDARNQRIRDVLNYSSLGRWLERETWTPKEALAILAGIDPARSSIKWTSPHSSEANGISPIIEAAGFFADWTTTFSLPHTHAPGQPKSMLLTAVEDSREWGLGDEEQEFLRKIELDQDSALDQLERLKRMQFSLRKEMLLCISQRWYSSVHDTESRQSPNFFIQWAEALGFEAEWFGWASQESLMIMNIASQGHTSSSVGSKPKVRSEKRWTDERLLELQNYRAKHTEKKTAEHFEISGALVRRLLAQFRSRNEPAPKSASPFSGLGKRR